jgi:UDP-N-acetylglucosamine:LPS N-acetylglucosamine transferase
MKICLACSAGGHLSEMLQLRDFYSKHGHFFITFKRADTESLAKNEKVFFIERPGRNPINTIKSFIQGWKIISREKPDIVISTGADVALGVCYAAKLHGKKVIFIESFCRPYTPGWTGRLVYPIADLFIVQWQDVKKYYKKAIYGGSIF